MEDLNISLERSLACTLAHPPYVLYLEPHPQVGLSNRLDDPTKSTEPARPEAQWSILDT